MQSSSSFDKLRELETVIRLPGMCKLLKVKALADLLYQLRLIK